ncbi:PIN domain-containing protein [Lachnospiraceae bacterium NE2001]|nr:PIN domain-containing protein [Lachnospiraceae bacterium NE2001]
MKVLFDTSIVLDALQGRKPWKNDAEYLVMAVAQERIEGFLTTKQLCDIWYLGRQIHKNEENASRKAQEYVSKLCQIFKVIDIVEQDIVNALSYNCADFEDAVIMAAAERTGMERIVTRNIKDYPSTFSSYLIKNLQDMRVEIEELIK